MADFSTILSSPEVRRIVQEKYLAREYAEALFPKLQFRAEAENDKWPTGVAGDSMTFTGPGLIEPKQTPLGPNEDPTPSEMTYEQWSARLHPYGDSVDVHMPTSMEAIASMFMLRAKTLGMSAGQSLNYIARNRLYNAALAGHTVADGAQNGTTALKVKRLNGFTRARRPDLATGEPVGFEAVSSNNPLQILVNGAARNVIGFTSATAGDEVGPGTLTLDAVVTVSDRDPVQAVDRTYIVRVGGGDSVDAVGTTDLFKFSDIRTLVGRFWTNNVPEFADGSYHVHLDPTSQSQIFSDSEFRQLHQGVPEQTAYKDYALTKVMGCTYYRNTQCPTPETVKGAKGGTFATQTFSASDPFAGEVFQKDGVKVHRPLFVGFGGFKEYREPIDGQLAEAGLAAKMMDVQVSNNGIEVKADGVKLIIRAPLDRLQQNVAISWYFRGDWTFRTDACTGGAERIKRVGVIEHGE